MKKNTVIDISELAEILHLSITTVSRVLNEKSERYRISTKTKERVLKAAKEYNYVPNQLARGLKMKKTSTIGLIIPDISNPFFADIAQSVEFESRNNGFSLILCDSRGDILFEEEIVNLLLSHRVEGIIIAPVGTESSHIIRTFELGTAIVVIDRPFHDNKIPYICSDNYQGGFDAVNYLISMGHKRIACIQGIPESIPSKERVRGYMDAHKKSNIPFEESLIIGENFSVENGYKQTRIIFSTENPPTAIFALSNTISLGVLQAANEIGITIPDDVSLVSFDDQPYSAFLVPPMTTVSQKKSEMGQFAVDLLIQQIKNKEHQQKQHINMKLKTELIVRKSVRNLNKIFF